MVHRNILLSDYLFPNSTSTPRERERALRVTRISPIFDKACLSSVKSTQICSKGGGGRGSRTATLYQNTLSWKFETPIRCPGNVFISLIEWMERVFFREIEDSLLCRELNWTEVTDWSSCRNFVKKSLLLKEIFYLLILYLAQHVTFDGTEIWTCDLTIASPLS